MVDARTHESIVVFLYLAAVAVIGLYVSRRSRGGGGSASEYYLAGRNLRWITIGASLFVTTAWGVLLAAMSHPSLLDEGILPWSAAGTALLLIVLAFGFAPMYARLRGYTVPQHWAERYDDATGLWLSVISILLNALVRVPLTIVAGCWLFQSMLGWDLLSSSMLMIVVSGLYAIAGGFRAVVSAQVMQAVVALAGLIVLSAGGGAFLLPGAVGSEQMTWTGFLVAALIAGIWYVGADQVVIQRVFGGRDSTQVRRGIVLAAGLMAVVAVLALVTGQPVAQSHRTAIETGFLSGLVGASLLSFLMSSLAGYFHSTSTLFTMDIYRRFRSGATDERLILVGRLCTTALVILAILVASSTALVDARVYALLMEGPGSFIPPVVAIVTFGLVWKRINARGAFWSLAAGMFLGLSHCALRVAGAAPAAWVDGFPVPFPLLSLIVSAAVLVVVSLFTLEGKRAAASDVSGPRAASSSHRVLGRGAVR